MTGASSTPAVYWQGPTSDPADSSLDLRRRLPGPLADDAAAAPDGGRAARIPPAVARDEGYNHIGDPTWNGGEGGSVLLPLECYVPGVGNTCGTGAFGVADPATLGFHYYVKLDPAEIPKAMWAETSPDGSLIWTSSGDDLLAYRTSDVTPANAGPSGPVSRAARRLPGAVPPSGITGAVFHDGRLLLAGERNHVYQVWSVDTATGQRRLEIEMRICGESEGLDMISTLDGELHWLIAPSDPGCQLTFGPTSALLHFQPALKHDRSAVDVLDVDAGGLPGEVSATIRATRGGRPLPQARVSFAGGSARTGRDGVAVVTTRLELPGRFRAVVRQGQNYGASELVPVGLPPSASSVRSGLSGAG